MMTQHLNSNHAALHPVLQSALAWLQAQDWAQLADGRYDVTDAIGVHVFTLETAQEGAYPEQHRLYCDVQYIIEGRERVAWAADEALATVREPYDAERDIAFYEALPEASVLFLAAGDYAIYPAGELHAVGVSADARPLRKAVIKIPQHLLS